MRSLLLIPALLLATSAAHAQGGAPAHPSEGSAPPAADVHPVSEIQWGPAPAALPKGAEVAVLQGNPFGKGPYTLRLKMPDGYMVPPHFHPTDEMVTVISGTLLLGHGDTVDESGAAVLDAGGFVTAPKNMHHYAIARGATIVQIHGMGPFAITYVHPADDPRKSSTQ